jgi:tRNA modification GTPase
MHDLNDTIVAVSSPSGGVRSIVRISGPQARCAVSDLTSEISDSHIVTGNVRVTDELAIDATFYLFRSPRSYTGDDLVEIHLAASDAIIDALIQRLLSLGLRPAEPGEFTARAYLNGKLDLAQAEAVNEVISSANRLQLEAAERLLAGRLKRTLDALRSELIDSLSLIEAGLDFSDGDAGPIRPVEPMLSGILERLESLLAESVRCQDLVDLPAVGIAGAPNAGKSSLLNALLGRHRSIVSPEPMTTRDVLTGVLTTDRFQCVLFDCAGLVLSCHNSLDELAQRAAVEAIRNCQLVLFCVEATKADWPEELEIRKLIGPRDAIHLATKTDLLTETESSARMQSLNRAFSADFLPTSSQTLQGLPAVVTAMERTLLEHPSSSSDSSAVALNARHRQAVTNAIENLKGAIAQVHQGQDEIAAMMIRESRQSLSQIEQQHIDEQILDRIFSRFCIGK